MSLHDEIMGFGIAYIGPGISASYALGFNDAKQKAAALATKEDAEIARLQSQFDPEKFAHRPDCCGPDIDTHCLGCAMAESNKGDMEVAALTIKIANLTRENADLRDLLRISVGSQNEVDLFEKWARPDCRQLMKTDEGDYLDRGMAAAWGGWAARAKLSKDEIARMAGEKSVLRDLLRDALEVVETINGKDDDEVASLYALTVGIREAIDGQNGDLFDGDEK